MLRLDPHALVREQLARDEARCAPFPGLFEHKLARMSASPLAFLRGAAPMFYAILAAAPDLAKGPKGRGWIAGDLHLENFGAYRPACLSEEGVKTKTKKKTSDVAAFDLNDFDDAVEGPWYFDVLRLTTSLLLAGRELHVTGANVLELADALVDAYVAHACHAAKLPPEPRPVHELLDRVRTRTRVELLDMRTKVAHGKREFVRGPRYRDVSARVQKKARAAFETYATRLIEQARIEPDHLEIIDMAFRVAGTGSLGGVRIAVLVKGKGNPDGNWIFDMKEEGTPSASVLVGKAQPKAAKRVVAAMRASLARPPRMLGTTKLGGISMLVRRLASQEDKLMLSKIGAHDLLPLARYIGALTGAAHRRGATRSPKKAWKGAERRLVVDRAITLAGLHEAAFLAMCARVLRS
jgi:uncharacterized protein (DUF2252 family)